MSTKKNNFMYFTPILAMFFGASIDAINKVLSVDLDPIFIIPARSILVVIIILILFSKKIEWKKILNPNKKINSHLFLSSISFGLGVLFLITGIQKGASLVNIALINSIIPIFVYLFSSFILKTEFRFKTLPLIILGVYGIAIIVTDSLIPGFENLKTAELFILCSTIFYAFATIFRKKPADYFSSIEVTLFSMIIISIFFGITNLLSFNYANIQNFNLINFSWLLLASIFFVIFYILATYATKHIGANLYSFLSRTKIIFSALIGYIFFNELLNSFTIIGGAIIIVSCIFIIKLEKGNY